jgi:hypothetical protein
MEKNNSKIPVWLWMDNCGNLFGNPARVRDEKRIRDIVVENGGPNDGVLLYAQGDAAYECLKDYGITGREMQNVENGYKHLAYVDEWTFRHHVGYQDD